MGKENRRSRWGCIRQTGERAWQIRYPSLNAEGEPGPRRSMTVHGSMKDAESVLRSLERNYRLDKKDFKRLRAEKEEESLSKHATLNQVWHELYLPKAKKKLSPTTVEVRYAIYNGYIRPALGLKRIQNITHNQVQALLDERTHSMAEQVKMLLRAIFKEAQNARIVKSNDNIMRDDYALPPASKRKAPKHDRIYSRAEVDEILTLCKGEPFEGAIILMGIGGARMPEACGAKFSDMTFIEREDGTWCRVNIERNAVICATQLLVRGTKTERSKRTIFIPEPYSLRLKELHDQAGEDEWVTDDGTGVPLASQRLTHLWRTWAREKAPRHVPFMYFRDSFATDMHNRGMDPYRIAQLLGHSSSSQMLYKHYDKPDDEALQKSFSDAYRDKTSSLDDVTKEKLMKLISEL